MRTFAAFLTVYSGCPQHPTKKMWKKGMYAGFEGGKQALFETRQATGAECVSPGGGCESKGRAHTTIAAAGRQPTVR